MNYLSYVIIAGLVASSIVAIVIFNPDVFAVRNFHVIKTEKILDDGDMWKLIHPLKQEHEEYLSTEGIDLSADGKHLAFGVNAGAPVSYLWTMNSTGGDLLPSYIPIEFNSISYVNISKDGNSVFFVGQYNSGNATYQDIFRYEVNAKSYSFVTKDSHVQSFSFMPDGNILYSESHSNSTRLEKNKPIFLITHYDVLWLAGVDGHKIKSLYNGTMLFRGMNVNPDGNKIAFVSDDDPYNPSSNGTDIVNFGSGGSLPAHNYLYFTIFDMTTKEFTVLEKTDNEGINIIKWLPDGFHILYTRLTHHCVQDRLPGTQSCPAGLLETINVSDHSSEVVYGNQAEPYTAPLVGTTLSPDGQSVIFGINYDFSNDDINGKGIYKMTFDKPLYTIR